MKISEMAEEMNFTKLGKFYYSTYYADLLMASDGEPGDSVYISDGCGLSPAELTGQDIKDLYKLYIDAPVDEYGDVDWSDEQLEKYADRMISM